MTVAGQTTFTEIRNPLPLLSRRDLLVFALAMFSFFEVEIVGRFFLVEGALLGIAVIGLLRRDLGRLPLLVRRIVLLASLWFVAQVATDLYRGIEFADYVRGWSKIFFFGSNIVALSMLVGDDERRIVLFIMGFAISDLFALVWFPNYYYEGGRIWKFGFGAPLTTLIIILLSKWGKPLFSFFILMALTALNLLLEFRSLAGFCFVAGMVTGYTSLVSAAGGKKMVKRVVWTLIALVLILLFARLYEAGEEMGFAADLGEWERHGEARNPLYGRLEFLVGLQAVHDSPIVGYGSWAKDINYAELMQILSREAGKESGPILDDLIPTHSYLIGAWVEAGFVGAIFWFIVLLLAASAMTRLPRIGAKSVPLFAFILASFLWAVLFSPFGAGARISAALGIVLIFHIRAKTPSSARIALGLKMNTPTVL